MSETPQSTKEFDNKLKKDISSTSTKADITGVLRDRTPLLHKTRKKRRKYRELLKSTWQVRITLSWKMV